jgi:D-methionine transport system ATP-binding protein
MIHLKEINKVFQTKDGPVTAVNNVNLNIEEGQIYGIIGYSGAGKSTLLRILNGLEKPTSGEVTIAGKAFSQLKGKSLRKERQKIGMIFQHFNLLWSRTVSENIQFPLEIAKVPKKIREEKAKELIRLVGLEGRENAYPSQLSGGQKQRVGIARALANDPAVLLCDEATSSLDPKTTDDVLELLLDINKKLNLTIVLITHEMNVVRKICDRVAVMDSGEVVEEGKVLDIFRHPKKEITEQFIREDTALDNEDVQEFLRTLKERYPKGTLARIVFQGDDVRKPIISQLSRKFDIDVTILQANIQESQEIPLGTLYVQLLGEEQQVHDAMHQLKQQEIEVEVIEDVAKV